MLCLVSLQWVNCFLCVDLLHFLGQGAVQRHVFDLDGVCHVGKIICATADVLKGPAGRGDCGAKAKPRPAARAHTDSQRAGQTAELSI